MLCDVCNSIDFRAAVDNRYWDPTRSRHHSKHHASFTDLQVAADQGCELCKLLADYGNPGGSIPCNAYIRHMGRSEEGGEDEDYNGAKVSVEEREQIFYTTFCDDGPDEESPSNGATKIYFHQRGPKDRYKGYGLHLTFGLFASAGKILRKPPDLYQS